MLGAKALLPERMSQEDIRFWRKMTSRDSEMDSPGMSCSSPLIHDGSIDIIVSTAAGKPLLHFGQIGREQDLKCSPRSVDELISLSAACVAFRYATSGRIRSMVGPTGTILSTNFKAIHVMVSASDRTLPLDFMVMLAKIAMSAVLFLLSSGFMTALETRPTLDFGSKWSYVQNFCCLFFNRAISYPLPCSLDMPVSLPCPSSSSAVARLGSILKSALAAHPGISHSFVFSASPPFPHRLVSAVFPVYSKPSPMDIFFVSCFLPFRTQLKFDLPERVFLQASSFSKPCKIFVRLVELRLDFDDYESFKSSVGGDEWRPDWSADGANSVWVVGVGDMSARASALMEESGNSFLNEVEKKLDRTSTSKDLMVYMERSWRVRDIVRKDSFAFSKIRGIIVTQRGRTIATVGALDYPLSIAVLRSLKRMSLTGGRVVSDGIHASYFALRNLWVISSQGMFVFVDGHEEEFRAVGICQTFVFTWVSANVTSLFPSRTYISLPPRTPLSLLFAPFES